MSEQRSFVLPVDIVSPTDISRLLREIEKVDGYFRQSEIRQSGEQQTAMPRLSKLLDGLATENKLNLLQAEHRQYLVDSLEGLHKSAPVLHVSFSVDPPGSYVQKIVAWLRTNVHSDALVTVGLQPNIGAGCIVRTTNKIFDFSLREFFNEKREFFIGKMHEAITEQAIESTTSPTDAVVAEVPAPIATTSSPSVDAKAAPQPQPPQATNASAPTTAPAVALEAKS